MSNKTLPHMNTTALAAIQNTKGRFFGLQTRNETFNAQLRGQTPCYLTVFDRNKNRVRRIAKNSVMKVNIA